MQRPWPLSTTPSIHHLLLFLTVTAISVVSKTTDPSDAAALQTLSKSLSNLPTSWSSNSDPCTTWSGISCSSSGRITSINLPSSQLSGTLDNSFNLLTALTSLLLPRNHLTGPLPQLNNLTDLQTLVLDANGFGSIPTNFFEGLVSLQKVSLDDIPFTGWSLNADLASATSLTEFSASNSSIIGQIPDFFGGMPSLRVLRMSYNSLTGGIPETFSGSNLQQMLINNQQSEEKLTGRIDVIGQMSGLVMVWLQSNGFTGKIPEVSNLTGLESFNVRDNALTGPVPASLISSETLKNVSLSNNDLQGPFPEFGASVTADVDKGNEFCLPTPGPCDERVMALLAVAEGFGYPQQLATSWKGNEPCGSNWLGITCDSKGKDVLVVNFANQKFGGVISPALGNISTLTKIVLSGNNLTGSVPDSLTQLSQLALLDVTDNNLSGKMPVFPPSVQLKIAGNPLLGKDTGSGGGGSADGTSGSPPSGSGSGGSKKSSVGLAVGIVIGILVVIGCLVALFVYYRRKKKGRKLEQVQIQNTPGGRPVLKNGLMGENANGNSNGNASTSVNPSANSAGGVSSLYMESSMGSNNAAYLGVSDGQGLQMSTQSLLMATDNFSDDNIVGRGGFGVVYKANLNGTVVAVKRNEYDVMGKKGQDEFRAEIDVLRKVRHRNLVALLGYSDDSKERLLVYEYMSGGTLGQHLFEWQRRNELPLTWKQRLTIALDVARGIEYLHSLAQESFIHRDLKPSNILLDKDLRAKVSDFGLVKLAEDKQKSMMTRLAGTFGYLAPEYATTGRASTKVDVYAFGVILMEMITGRKVLDESLPSEDCNLVPLFRRKYSLEKTKFFEFVDRSLDLDDDAQQSLLEVADLAWHCTAREHYQRPDMSHAVNRIAPLVDQWKPSALHEDDDDGESSMSLDQRLDRWRHDDSSSTQLFSGYR